MNFRKFFYHPVTIACAFVLILFIVNGFRVPEAEPLPNPSTILQDIEQIPDGAFVLEHLGNGYYRDTVTDVMYLWNKYMNAGGLTIMADPESGLPLTYARYMELANATQE